jgi:predicted amidohydrolase YtcJ
VECRDLYDPGIDSVEALVTRMGQWAASTPPGQWIVARGSPLADFRLHERRLPTQAELDGALPRNPAYVSFGAHVIIANSLALRERGVTRDTPSPQGGTVVKDPMTGEPTGELRERAQFLVKRRDSEVDPETLAERIAVELEKCSHRGVTCVHDIVVTGKRYRPISSWPVPDACRCACTCSYASSSRISTSIACTIWVWCTASVQSGCRLAVSR